MSNRSKGALHEKKVADYFKAQGYLVERSFGKPGWRPGKGLVFCARDLFGFCDILAIKPPAEVRMIQVTSGAVAVRRAKAFTAWPSAEVWEHLRSGIYRVHHADGRTSLVDVKGQAA